MGNYYFLAPSLPPLFLGEKPELSFEELASRLAINLKREDVAQTVVLRRYLDLSNIRALFLEESVDPRGNLSEKELDEALLLRADLPDYVFDFLDQFENVTEKVRNFSGLFAAYFVEEGKKASSFLKAYLEFERGWRLVILAIRAKELGRDIARELQFEDATDPLTAWILAQQDSDGFEPPPEYASLKDTYAACGPDPWQQYRAVAKWRLEQIENLVNNPLFSIDWVLAYMAKLLIVEHYQDLDDQKGKMILEAFVA